MKTVLDTLIVANDYLKTLKVDGTITYRSEKSHLVRCGRSQISLNTSEEGSKFFLDLQLAKRQFSSSTSCSPNDIDALKKLIDHSIEKIDFMPEISHLTEINTIESTDMTLGKIDEEILNLDTKQMVDFYHNAFKRYKNENVEISGAFSTGFHSYALINTKSSTPLSYKGSDWNVEIVLQMINDDKKELRSFAVGENLKQFNENNLFESIDRDLALKKSTERISFQPKEIDVVFGPEAFTELTSYMSWLTFGGETYEYQSGMLQKENHELGSKLFGENINIIDDPVNGSTLFNRIIGLNGVKRESFPLIENGILKNFYYSDKETCDEFGKVVNNDFGTSSIEVSPGNGPSTFDELIATIKVPTLYIGFIHYMNFVNPAKGDFTGTSRFGTWLIEDGKVTGHLYNVRINDSYHRIFNNVEWLSNSSTNVNTSNTYGLRNPSSIKVPKYTLVKNVNISASSGSNKDT